MRDYQLDPGRRFYFLLFTVSGFAGLVYESVWTQYIKLFLGHAAYAQALVLSIFMAGLALGSWLASRYCGRWRNLLVAYALAEALIGLAALVFHRAFVAATDAAYDHLLPALGSVALAQTVKWTLAAGFILPQSVLLGMTFPLMSGGLIRRYRDAPGRSLSMLYFTNSVGAAIGVLVGGFFLVGRIGLPGSMMAAGALNLVIALAVWLIAKEPKRKAVSVAAPAPVAQRAADPWFKAMLAAAFVTGAASFVYEIAWIRGLSLVLGSATHSFELMLSAFILGLALGGLWMSRRIERTGDLPRLLGWMQVLMGLCALGTLPMFGGVFELMQHFMQGVSRTQAGYQLYNVSSHVLCLLIMLPATFFAGTTLPLMTYALIRRGAGESAIGAVYAANTLGAIFGVLIAVHGLMPMLGLKGTITAGASLDLMLGLALLLAIRPRLRHLASAIPAAAVVLVALAGTAMFVQLDPKQLLSGVYRSGEAALPEDAEVLYLKDGKTATVGLIRAADGVVHISTNGKTDAALRMAGGDFSPDEATMILAAILPLATHPDARSAANIGMGSGLTTHTLLATEQLERVDTIEIERFMVEAARHFGPRVERAFSDARSHIYIEDAKTFFSTRNRKYDIIISEPSNPWVSGVATLFSQEFYQRIGHYLEDDGVLVQWLQLYEADISLVASIVKALSPHFSDYVLYNSNDSDLLLVAKRKGSLPRLSDKVLVDPQILRELARIRVAGVQDLEARRIGSKRTLDAMFQSFGSPSNSDYFPFVDQNAARMRFMRMAGIELTGLTVHFLPILEMLNEDGPAAANLTQTAWLTRARAVSDAQQLRTALLERRYGDMPRTVEPGVLLPYLFVDACDRGQSEELWIDAMVKLAGFLTPYLPPDELEPVWRRLEREACFKHLTGKQRAWFALVQAVGRRDPEAMASRAERILEAGYAAGGAPRLRYAVLSAMLGHIVRGTPGKAWLLWAKHGSRVMPMDNPPLDARLLLALTGPESHFAKRGRKSKAEQVARVTSGTPTP